MNESTASSAFQKLFRETVPGAVVVKHADKSMIGMPDASITYNKKTLWLEYKFIGPQTKGVNAAEFMRGGWFWTKDVAEASPTQYDMMKRLGVSGNALYICWVLDYAASRKNVGYILAWEPITGLATNLYSNRELVTFITTNILTSDTKVPL